jgi:hypothetical protein
MPWGHTWREKKYVETLNETVFGTITQMEIGVHFTLEHAMKAYKGSRDIAVLFL